MIERISELMKDNKRIYLEVKDNNVTIHVKVAGKDYGRIKGYKSVETIESCLQIDEIVKQLRAEYLVNYLKKGSNILLVRKFKNK